MTAFFWRLVTVLGSALVFQFFSEFYFVNEGPAAMVLAGFDTGTLPVGGISVFLASYMLFAYIFHIAIARFSVRSVAGLLLAGSLYGWAAEALVVPVAHEAPPISWIWTSASWHPLIDVLAGWYLIRLAMRRLAWPWLALIFIATGAIWAYWSTWFWGGTDADALAPLTVQQFVAFAAVTGASWIAGMVLADIGAARSFRPHALEIIVVGAIALILYASWGAAFLPWSLGLLTFIALTLAVLWRGAKSNTSQPDILAGLSAMPPVFNYVLAVLMPVSAVGTYSLIVEYDIILPVEDVVLLLVFAGFVTYLWALWRTVWPNRRASRNAPNNQ